MTKNPEEIIAEFEDRFGHICAGSMHYACESEREIKSFLTESLAAYRLSVLSECEGLVEDVEGHGDSYPMTYEQGFNAANALWRERIDEIKKK